MNYPKLKMFDIVETRDGRRGVVLGNPIALAVYVPGHGCSWFIPGACEYDHDSEYLEDLTIGDRWVYNTDPRDYDIMYVWSGLNPMSVVGSFDHSRPLYGYWSEGNCTWRRE